MTSDSSLRNKKVLITQTPFSDNSKKAINYLKKNNIDFTLNPFGRIPTEEEMLGLVSNYAIILAGTAPITSQVIENAPNLKLIARAGVGLDNIDLNYAKTREIEVTYTPDAPAPAVAEFTVGLMLVLLRHIGLSDRNIHNGQWKKYIGRRLRKCVVGVIGVNRTGKKLIQLISGFGPSIIANDIRPDYRFGKNYDFNWVDKKTLLSNSDIITLHVPLTDDTHNLIGRREFDLMKSDSILINTSRGGIVNEDALIRALNSGKIKGAALDVFEREPYDGPLREVQNCILTSHMASATSDCLEAMEMGAAKEIVRFLKGKPLQNPIPESEYEIQPQ